jgi:RNA polymerase sigma-70 factor (ECF subfamily)
VFNEKRLEKSMIALKNGDDSSFDIIYEETYRLVYYIVYSIIKSKSQSEDLMQAVYMKVYEKINLYTNSPKAWISSIARNLAINEYNKNKKNNLIALDDDLLPTIESDDNRTPLIGMASNILENDEFTIVMLCVTQNYTRKEAAKLLGLSTSGVTWKLNQALEKLRKELENENK